MKTPCWFAVCLFLTGTWGTTIGAEVLSVFPFEIYSHDRQLAHHALNILQESKEEMAPHLAVGTRVVRVFLCTTPGEFHRFAGAYSIHEVAGVARPEAGVIAVKVPGFAPANADFDGTLRHEFIHVLLERNTDTSRLPPWLNEGLAMYFSREHRWGSAFYVGRMYLDGSLLSYRDLNVAFLEPGMEVQFGNAYAESLLLTRYFIHRFGEQTLWDVLNDLRTRSFGDSLRARIGMGPADLFRAWVNSLWWLALVVSLVSGFGLFQVMAVLCVVGYWVRRKRQTQRLLEWEEEEQMERQGEYEEESPWE